MMRFHHPLMRSAAYRAADQDIDLRIRRLPDSLYLPLNIRDDRFHLVALFRRQVRLRR